MGGVRAWKKCLDLAYPAMLADRGRDLARAKAKLGEPSRMKALQATCRSDPDWADPCAGLGEPVSLDGVGRYPHAQAPDRVYASALPVLARTPAHA